MYKESVVKYTTDISASLHVLHVVRRQHNRFSQIHTIISKTHSNIILSFSECLFIPAYK